MAKRLALFTCLAVAVVLVAGNQAVGDKKDDKRSARQTLEDLLYDPYSLDAELPLSFFSYQPSPRIGDFQSEGRSFYTQNPLRYPFYKGFYEETQPQARLNGLGASAINNLLFNNRFSNNNRVRPFASLSNFIPVQWNPNFPNLATTFDSCTAPSGESGICAPGSVCSVFGGRPSGSCGIGGVCCVNAITTCGSTVTLNNTYWQSPTTAINTPSTCSLTIKLDSKLVEQKKPICQVRLDFVAFTTVQPTAGVCTTDTFQVGGSSDTVPQICGDNAGQHMYLNVPNSATSVTDLQLLFNFGAGAAVTRSWNIRVSLLPCGADYLAPTGCLQYFSSSTGRVTSFNYNSVPAVRQLANQAYNICFRTELVNGQRANSICMEACTVPAGNLAYRISGAPAAPGAPVNSQAVAAGFCNADFLVFIGATSNNVALDRLCGGTLTTASDEAVAATVCSNVAPFRLYYQTNGDENGDDNNVGFCLNFQQRFA